MSADDSRDFETVCLRPGVHVHVRPTRRYKSVWVDVFHAQPLRRPASTRWALTARLLERGTRRLPDLLSLNRHTDDLYGASLSATAESAGAFQLLHLHYDAVDSAFLPAPAQDLLAAGFDLLGDVLHDPYLESGGFPATRVEHEKQALRRYVEGLHADRGVWAQRRFLQHMCGGEPYALAAHGEPEDLPQLDAGALWQGVRGELDGAPLDVYVCGDVDPDSAARLCATHLDRAGTVAGLRPPPRHRSAAARQVHEAGDVAQGRLLIGWGTGLQLGADGATEMAALLLLNLLFGGDVHSRLYSQVREAAGLCYHIASYTEPMAGLLVVEAGVEAADRERVVAMTQRQLSLLADPGPTAAELERTRALARQRLEGIEDGREGLVRYHAYRRLAGADVSRRRSLQALEAVTVEDLAAVAAGLQLDTVYYLAPEPQTETEA